MLLHRSFASRLFRALRAPEDDQGLEYEDDGQGGDDGFDDPDEQDPDELDENQDPDETEDDLDDEPPAEQRRPSRAQTRVQAATTEAKAARERAEKAERELAALRAGQQQQRLQESAAERENRLAAMDPVDRTNYLLHEMRQQTTAEINQIRFEAQDSADKTAFNALCASNKAAAAVKDEVEAKLKEMRAAGTTAPRETVLRYILGDRALARAPRAVAKAERQATANHERQQGRPASGRGDASASDGRKAGDVAARNKRLSNMQL